MQQPGGHDQVVGERAGAGEPDLVVAGTAEVGVPGAASVADLAVHEALADRRPADQGRVDAGPGLLDRPRPFVAGNDGEGPVRLGATALVQLTVAAADARRGHADEDLTGARLGYRSLDQPLVPRPLQKDRPAHLTLAGSRRCQLSANRLKLARCRGNSASASRFSSTPRPGASGRATWPSTTSGRPGATLLIAESAKSLKCSWILKLDVQAAR